MKYIYGLLLFLFPTYSFSQCLQIESVLVDACGPEEGLNEMVRFRVGNAALNTSNLDVNWPNNDWEGLIQNGITASKVAALNADIIEAGGCGQLLQPTNGVLPANSIVILVTSFNFDTSLNEFGPITDSIYILFQNNPNTTSGHFANSGTGMRTLQISFGGCSDSVTYNRALLIDQNGAQTAGDGATVQFTTGGQATYTNNGCSAPVPPFTVEAGNSPMSVCAGSQITLNGSAQGQQSLQWTAASGTFSNPSSLSTTYTVSPQATGTITLTLTGTNSCGATISDIVLINVTAATTPNFQTQLTLCQGAAAPILNTTSPNGISGTWNPATINNQANGTYIFTPNAGQCAVSTTLSVTVTNGITPDFQTQLTLCQGEPAPILATTSPNGISGTWNPATVNNQANGTYIFTPNAGQCAVSTTLSVTVTNGITPDFQTQLTLCQGATAPILATTSPNGISGTWNPATINNQANGTYTFTPNAGQCSVATTLSVTVTNSVTPDFETQLTLCQGEPTPILAATSPNGVSGTWSPTTIDSQNSGTYVFTPNEGQCAQQVTLTVSVLNRNIDIEQFCDSGDYILQIDADNISEPDPQIEWTDASGAVIGNSETLNLTQVIGNSTVSFPAEFTVSVALSSGCVITDTYVVDGIFCTIPKGVSANGDGANDSFDLTGLNVSELKIFNRYGLEVFSKRNYTKEWNGQSDNGNELPDGTYYYALTTVDGKVRTGWVYLIRKA